MNEEDINVQKGIRFNATFGQLLSALMLVLVLFVLPVGGYEYLNARINPDAKEVYTTSTLSGKSDEKNQGQVAGVSTSKVGSKIDGAGDTISFVAGSTTLLIAAGIVLMLFSVLLGGSLLYDFWKK